MTIVSTNTPSACTKPCSHGWFASAIEAACVDVPIPASLERSPRFKPCAIATPNAPPKIACGLNAPTNTAARKPGTLFRFKMIKRTTITIYPIAITGTTLSENFTTLLIPPKVMTAIMTTIAIAIT